jgi:hypothetical protein
LLDVTLSWQPGPIIRSIPTLLPGLSWLSGKSVILCPLSELGFLRISTNKKAINAPMEKSTELLKQLATDRKAVRIADDLPALDSHEGKSEEVTDHLLG